MGGKGSGGHNRKTLEQHVLSGTYREDRHGALPNKLKQLLVSKTPSAKQQKKDRATERDVTLNKQSVTRRSNNKKNESTIITAPISTILQCPEWFDEIAKKEWSRVCGILQDRGTLVDVNHATLEGYCASYSRACNADKSLMADGFEEEVEVIVGRGDRQTTIPVKKRKVEVSIAEKAWNQVKMFAIELGITSNEGIKEKMQDEMADFLDSQAKKLATPAN